MKAYAGLLAVCAIGAVLLAGCDTGGGGAGSAGVTAHSAASTLQVISGTQIQWIASFVRFRCDSP